MRHLLPLCALLGSLSIPLAAESAPTPPPPGLGGFVTPPGELSKDDRRALMKEYMELNTQLAPLREKAALNPELIKLKADAEAAQKAVRAKEDELMAADPAFADLKVKRDQLQEKMAAAGLNPNGRPPRKEGKDGKPPGAPPAPPASEAGPGPAPKL